MKKLLVLTLAMLAILSCATKQPNTAPAATTWSEDDLKGSVKSVTTTAYRENGEVLSRYTEHFNQQQQPVESIYYKGDTVVSSRKVATYDSNSKLTLDRTLSYLNGEARDTIDLTYTYNDKGLPAKTEERYKSTLLSKVEKEYNDEGLLVRSTEGDEDSETTYTYDKSQRLTEEKRAYLRTAYTYDKNGWLVKTEDYENGSDLLLMTRRYEYNDNGWLVKETARDAESPSTLDYDKTFSYDEMGRELELKIVDAEGRVQRHITFTYNEKGNMVEHKRILNHSLITETSAYTYDEADNWVEAAHNFDGITITVTRKVEYYQ